MTDEWKDVGRDAVRHELQDARGDVEETFGVLEDTLRDGETPTAEDVHEARLALNEAREVLEDHVAAVTDETDPWSPPVSRIPFARLHALVDHPDHVDAERE